MNAANWIAIGALCINLGAFTLVLIQLSRTRSTFVAEHTLAKKRATMDYIVATTDLRDRLASATPNERDLNKVDAFVKQTETDPKSRKQLVDFLNYWESLAAGANSDIYDVGVLKRAVGGMIISIPRVYGEFIRRERAARNRPTVFAEIEQLAKDIEDLP